MSEGQPWGRSAELRTEVGLSGGQGRVMCMEGAGGSRGPDAGSGVVSGAVGCLASVVTGGGCPAGGIRALSLTLWPLPWRSGALNRLLVWRRSLCFVLLVQIFPDIKLP